MTMLLKYIQKLGEHPLAEQHLSQSAWNQCQYTNDELQQLYSECNGLFAYNRALLIRPFTSTLVVGLVDWNIRNAWNVLYPWLSMPGIAFAESVFGEQFVVNDNGVLLLDPETGDTTHVADSLRGWLEWIGSSGGTVVGSLIAERWSTTCGEIPVGFRLVPRLPAVLGGAYDPDNLVLMRDQDGIEFRAALARQIKRVPNGSKIILKEWPFS